MAEAYTTVVTREPEWTEHERIRMEALEHYEATYLCTCCGQPREEAHRKGSLWLVDTVVCQAGRALTIAQRDRAQSHLPPKERKHGWKPGVGEPDDGLLWTVTPHNPDTLEVGADG